jgi:hypothetical protein
LIHKGTGTGIAKNVFFVQVMLLDAETTPIVSLAFAQSALMKQVREWRLLTISCPSPLRIFIFFTDKKSSNTGISSS